MPIWNETIKVKHEEARWHFDRFNTFSIRIQSSIETMSLFYVVRNALACPLLECRLHPNACSINTIFSVCGFFYRLPILSNRCTIHVWTSYEERERVRAREKKRRQLKIQSVIEHSLEKMVWKSIYKANAIELLFSISHLYTFVSQQVWIKYNWMLQAHSIIYSYSPLSSISFCIWFPFFFKFFIYSIYCSLFFQ